MFEGIVTEVIGGVILAALLGLWALRHKLKLRRAAHPDAASTATDHGPENGVWIAAPIVRNAGVISATGPDPSVTLHSENVENTGEIRTHQTP